jgi:WD40 repeat protein
VSSTRTVARLALVLALLALAGDVGYLKWRRAHRPLCVIPFGDRGSRWYGAMKLRFLDDGRLLAVTGQWPNKAPEWTTDAWSLEPLERVGGFTPEAWAASPRNDLLVHVEVTGRVPPVENAKTVLRSARTGRVVAVLGPRRFQSAFSPTGDLVATAIANQPTVELRSARDGSLVDSIAAPDTFVTALAFSPRGTSVVGLASDQFGKHPMSFVWSFAEKKTTVSPLVPGALLVGVTSRDEIVDYNTTKQVYSLSGADGKLIRTLAPRVQADAALCLSPSGEVLAWCGSETVEVRSFDTGELRRRIDLRGRNGVSPVLSPSGDRFAVVTSVGVEVWEIPP